MHSDGASFHACHLADVLLHIPAGQGQARDRAAAILAGIRGYLARTMAAHNGRLVSLAGQDTPRTLYAFAICPALSLPLPHGWRQTAMEVLSGLEAAGTGVMARCFGVMNSWYLYSATRDHEFRVDAERHARRQLAGLAVTPDLDAVEVSLLVRALCYGVRLIDGRLAEAVARAAKVAATHAERELLADDQL